MPTIPTFTPTTWVEGAAPGISAAQLQRIDDQVDALTDGFGGVAAIQVATAQSVDDDTNTIISFSTELHDDWNNTGTNPIDIPGAGVYMAVANIRWDGASGGIIRRVRIETVGVIKAEEEREPRGVFSFTMNVTWVGFLTAFDDLRVNVYQDSGGAINVQPGALSTFSIARLGVPA